MKFFNLAIEKGKRYFYNGEIIPFYFIATEFIFEKNEIISGEYHFEFKSNNKIFYQQTLQIDVEEKKVFVKNSHEDPLTESDTHFFISGQLTEELIKTEYKEIECAFYYKDKLIRKQELSHIEIKSLFKLYEWNSKVSGKEIIANKDCIIRVHLGKSDASYEEEDYKLKINQSFDFSQYLEKYEYVAVQCSYEDGIDIEEKHVFKGIKGIFNSRYYYDKELFIPMIPFSEKYTVIENDGWIDIKSIAQLIQYYKEFPEEINKTFEMDKEFLIPFYKKYKTSSFGKIYSSENSKKYHIDSDICQECNIRSECMQLVPSGLSEQLFKKNLIVESFKNCSINKIIKKKE